MTSFLEQFIVKYMIYFSLFLAIFSFFCALYAIARVRTAINEVKKVGFEDFADVHSDVQALKNQLNNQKNLSHYPLSKQLKLGG